MPGMRDRVPASAGKGSGTAVEGPEGGTKKTPDYKYFCEKCETERGV
jgi:hypothetical protein